MPSIRTLGILTAAALGLALVSTPPAFPQDTNGPPVDIGPPTGEQKKTENQARRMHQKMGRARVKLAKGKQGLKAALKKLCDTLDGLLEQVEAGTLAPESPEFIMAFQDALMEAAFDMIDIVKDVKAGIAADAEQVMGGMQDADPSALGFLAGDCGTTETLAEAIDKEAEKFVAAVMKKMKKFIKKVKKGGQANLNGNVAPAPPGIVNPTPPAQPQPLPPKRKKFTMDAKASSAKSGTDGVGILCVGGQADPAGGNTINVRIIGPDGNEAGSAQGVQIDGKCRWRVCFEKLPSGPYRVEATETFGGATIEQDFSVPSARPR